MRSSATSRARATASSRRRSASGRLPRPTGLVTGWASTGPSGPPPSLRGAMSSPVHRLELDLDVFAGPFDLLLSLILREELDLLEVDLADVVVSYLDHLEATDALDLEAATEFLVLIAALLELKSRLMLPGEELPELDELAPAEAAEALLERMLQYARFRGAGRWLAERHDDQQGHLWRAAAPPPRPPPPPPQAASRPAAGAPGRGAAAPPSSATAPARPADALRLAS